MEETDEMKNQLVTNEKLRKKAGNYLKRLRLERDLTQNQLAKKLGLEYYTFISQVENGSRKIPYYDLTDWANALNTDPKSFALTLGRMYEPSLFNAIGLLPSETSR